MTTVRQLMDACKCLPDDAVVRPQWVPGCEPSDHEPGVRLRGVEQADGEVLLRVELFYLDEITDEEEE